MITESVDASHWSRSWKCLLKLRTRMLSVFKETRDTFLWNSEVFSWPISLSNRLTWFADYTPISGDTPPPNNLMGIGPHFVRKLRCSCGFAFCQSSQNRQQWSGCVQCEIKKSRQNTLGIAGLKAYSEYDALINQSPGVCLRFGWYCRHNWDAWMCLH